MTSKMNEPSDHFIEVLEKNTGILVKISSAYAINYHDREDLTNDIIFQMWKSFRSFKGESKISTWIYRVALNTCMNYHLKKQKESLVFFEDLTKLNVANLIETSFAELDQYNILYECINELTSLNKAIIILYLDGNSHEEISAITGISITNVGTRMGRIKEQLKKSAVKK